MKKSLFLLLCALIAAPLFAQTPLIQNGLVREQNSGKRPIADVQIIFANAVPTTSEQSGKFRLAFSGKKAGNLVFMTNIKKTGYELVNKKELEHITLTDSDKLPTDIIVAKAGVVDAAKKQYYAISDIALKTGFERQKAQLRQALQNAKMTQQQFQDQFDALQKQYDNQKKVMDELSEKFAKVNFDDVSALYQEALQLFKDGKIDQAIQKLEGANLNKQTEKIIKESNAIDAAEKSLAERKAVLEKTKKQQIETIQLLAQLYATQFKIDSAEVQYDQLLLLDSTNLDILWNCASFYKDNHRYEKALRLCPFIIAHPKAENWRIANAYCFMGDLCITTGDLNKAMTAYTKYCDAYTSLSKNDTTSTFYKENLAISYSRLGNTHTALGNLDKALLFYEDYLKLIKELYQAYPNNMSFKNGLAISYEKLGTTHTDLGNLDKALRFYEDDLKLTKELYEAYPNNVEFKNGLASSYEKLGNTHTALGNLDKALWFYEDFANLIKKLYEAYPNNMDFKKGLASSYTKLGQTHTGLGNLDKALRFYEDDLKLTKDLYESYPNNVSFKNGLAISYSRLGETHTALGNLDKALRFYEDDLKLIKDLYESYPNNVSFKNGLAISYSKLGETHIALGNLDKALRFYEDCANLFKELYNLDF